MKRTYIFENAYGTFISFLDYEDEGDFKDFVDFVCSGLQLTHSDIIQTPYSRSAKLKARGGSLFASWSSDAGCHIRIPLEADLSAIEIVDKLYG